MRNKMKKMVALLLTAIMAMSMCMTAFAAKPQSSVTIQAGGTNAQQGAVVKAYKFFDLTKSQDGNHYGYAADVTNKAALIAALNTLFSAQDMPYKTNPTDDALYHAVAEVAKGKQLQKFADDFATRKDITATDINVGTAANLDYGYYLFYYGDSTAKYHASLVNIDSAVETVVLKGEGPSITKKADVVTAEIGQVVTYTITGTIPNTFGYTDYKYILHDTLSSGLDFWTAKENGQKAGSPYSVQVSISKIAAQPTGTVPTATLAGVDSRQMTLDLSAWIKSTEVQAHQGKEFTVTYFAKVNKDAVLQNNNKAYLEYTNAPGQTTETVPQIVKTPTFPLDINKYTVGGIDQTKTFLAGAEFEIYKQDPSVNQPKAEAIKVVKIASGSYHVAENQQGVTTTTMVSATNELQVGGKYNLRLNGLAAGTYYLKEVKAPDGYNRLDEVIIIEISYDQGSDTYTVKKSGDTSSNTNIIEVENKSGTLLPETGGMHTVIFTVVAVVMVLGVVVSFVRSRRKEIR